MKRLDHNELLFSLWTRVFLSSRKVCFAVFLSQVWSCGWNYWLNNLVLKFVLFAYEWQNQINSWRPDPGRSVVCKVCGYVKLCGGLKLCRSRSMKYFFTSEQKIETPGDVSFVRIIVSACVFDTTKVFINQE